MGKPTRKTVPETSTVNLAVALDGSETLQNVWWTLEMIKGVESGAVSPKDLNVVYIFLGSDADVSRVSRAAAMIRGVKIVYNADVSKMQTFLISVEGNSIRCLVCGKTSHNPSDVAQQYCGHCHMYHADMIV